MKRPIGVTLLALGAGLIGLFQLYRMLVFLGITSFNFGIGPDVTFPQPQWGQAFWALLLAGIWFWEAAGFWSLRAYAYSFGIFIAMFTLIWGFLALIGGSSSYELETIPWFLALVILLYLQYPGVRDHFIKSEMDRLTPEQRAAYAQVQAANEAAMRANAAAAAAPAAAPVAAPAPAPAPVAAPAPAAAPVAAPAPAPAPQPPADPNTPTS